jgi:hypothetical protein
MATLQAPLLDAVIESVLIHKAVGWGRLTTPDWGLENLIRWQCISVPDPKVAPGRGLGSGLENSIFPWFPRSP